MPYEPHAHLMDPWSRVYRRAARQHGVVTRAQAVHDGVSASAFNRRSLREQWRRPHRRVFVVPGMDAGFLTRASAALHAINGAALLTADAGLHLHGVLDRPPRQPTLVLPHSSRAPKLAGVQIVRSRTLLASDHSMVRNLATAVPSRCFLDAATSCDRPRLRGLLIDARQRNVVTPAAVIERIASLPSRAPGRDLLLSSAVDVDLVGADSVLSDLVHRRLAAAGLLPDAFPVEVVVDGRHLHPDITFSPAQVCIECDSLAFHRTQQAIDLDHRKDQAYSRARWKCLRIGWRRFDRDWNGFVANVRHALVEWPRVVAALER